MYLRLVWLIYDLTQGTQLEKIQLILPISMFSLLLFIVFGFKLETWITRWLLERVICCEWNVENSIEGWAECKVR